MKVDPNPQVITNKDETLSYSGKKDFATDEMPEITRIGSMKAPTRPRSKKSENNSYT